MGPTLGDALLIDVNNQPMPDSLAILSLNSIISRNFQVVSTCIRGKGGMMERKPSEQDGA